MFVYYFQYTKYINLVIWSSLQASEWIFSTIQLKAMSPTAQMKKLRQRCKNVCGWQDNDPYYVQSLSPKTLHGKRDSADVIKVTDFKTDKLFWIFQVGPI